MSRQLGLLPAQMDVCVPLWDRKKDQTRPGVTPDSQWEVLFLNKEDQNSHILEKPRKIPTNIPTPFLIALVCSHGYSLRQFSGCLFYSERFSVIPLWQSLAFVPKTCMGNWAGVAETARDLRLSAITTTIKRGPLEDGQSRGRSRELRKPFCMSDKNLKEEWESFWRANKGFTQKPEFSAIGSLGYWEDTGGTHISKEDVSNHEQACSKRESASFFPWLHVGLEREAAAVGGTA